MQQQQGGSQYGVPPPELNPPFFSVGAGSRQQRHVGIHGGVEHLHQPVAEAASPISSRSAPPASIFDDFGGGGGVVMRGISDEEALCAGEEGERGASGGGNRWPRQETLVLLKVRSEMDSAFRDATLKGPLWEDVSRKLAELGYMRSAKKCKEKFENVHKYYKRTKEGRAGRQDGKSYRFFTQLEALHTPAAVGAAISSFSLPPPNTNLVTPQIASVPPPPAPRSEPPAAQLAALPPSAPDLAATVAGAGVSFSSNTSSSSSSDSDGGEDTDDGCAGMLQEGRRKRKRESWPGTSGKTMAFFEGLMKELMERQEVMQQRFLDTIEKREQDRAIREEAWKRQEMARLNREYELMAQERTMAANRDAAVISFLQKFTGGMSGDPPPPANAALASPEPSPEEGLPQAAQPAENQRIHQRDDIAPLQPPSQSMEPDTSPAAAVAEMAEVMAGDCLGVVSPPLPSTSRWPKAEVLALIKLRSGLDTRYMDSGPKGPLWEEISQAMKRLGYSRSTKRCKEKWENINKYFKKVKEGNKKRPEDAKTCPYYHELDALYRKKLQQEIAANINPDPPVSRPVPQQEISNKNPAAVRNNFGNCGNFEGGGGGGGVQLPRSNGAGISQVFFGGALSSGGGAALKKPEDIIKELMEQQHHGDEDEYDEDEEDDEEEEDDDGKLRYEIQFQRQNVGTAASGGPRGGAPEKAPPPSASNAGSFLAMVQ